MFGLRFGGPGAFGYDVPAGLLSGAGVLATGVGRVCEYLLSLLSALAYLLRCQWNAARLQLVIGERTHSSSSITAAWIRHILRC